MTLIERSYVRARELIARASWTPNPHNLEREEDLRRELRDCVKRLHGAAITNAGAVDDLRALLESVENLRGWRVQGQERYLAHVDAVRERVESLIDRLGGQ